VSLTLGVDVGQRRDPAALAIVEGLDVRHVERLALGTSYLRVADRIAALAAEAGDIPIVLDVGGVGRAVADMVEARGLLPTKVTLTGGSKVHVRGCEVSLPRSALFTPLVAAVQAHRLQVARPMPYAEELLAELAAMRDADGKVESRGQGHHGDLATAVALAVFGQGLASLRAA